MAIIDRFFRGYKQKQVGKAVERDRRRAFAKFAFVWSALAFLLLFLPGPEVQAAHVSPGVIATVDVGSGPVGVDANPTTNRTYVSNTLSNTVSVIDGATNAVIAAIPVGDNPAAVGVNPITRCIYVVNQGLPGVFASVTVSVIDGIPGSPTENTLVQTIQMPGNPGNPPQIGPGVAVNPITNRIYVTKNDPAPGGVFVINGPPGPGCVSNTVQTEIAVAANPRPVAVNPVTNKIYVGHGPFFGRSRITVIDGATNTPSNCTDVGLEHTGIGVNPTTDRVYVTRAGVFDRVAVFGGACTPVIASIAVGDQPTFVGVNPNTDRVYVATNNVNSVDVIDGTPGSPTENTVVATVPVGTAPNGVGVNPNTDRVYVGNNLSDDVSVIGDLDTTAPTLSLPPNAVNEATSPAGAVHTFTATATDSVDPSPTVVCTPPSGSTFPLGVTTINCTATDASGNSTSGSFTKTVQDTTPPVLIVPPSVTLEVTQPGAAVHTFSATATDIADPSPSVTCTPPSGTAFPLGATTTVNCTATDASGNRSSGSFTVTVILVQLSIDIKPGSDPNSLNLNGNGVLPVVIFGTSTVNANDINVSSVRIGVIGTEAAAVHDGHIEDLNGDGVDDLVLHFRKGLGIPTSTPGNTMLTLTLTGTFNDGREIEGTDNVRITPNNSKSRGKGGKGPK